MKRPSVFISYRREDTLADAGRLYDHLNELRFKVFMDIYKISAADVFPQQIQEALDSSDALIAVIGRQWLTVTDESGRRRLDDEEDYVRFEVATALERDDVRVIPILVQGATMPRKQDLPDPLKPLAGWSRRLGGAAGGTRTSRFGRARRLWWPQVSESRSRRVTGTAQTVRARRH
jgi:hypothetical protein